MKIKLQTSIVGTLVITALIACCVNVYLRKKPTHRPNKSILLAHCLTCPACSKEATCDDAKLIWEKISTTRYWAWNKKRAVVYDTDNLAEYYTVWRGEDERNLRLKSKMGFKEWVWRDR